MQTDSERAEEMFSLYFQENEEHVLESILTVPSSITNTYFQIPGESRQLNRIQNTGKIIDQLRKQYWLFVTRMSVETTPRPRLFEGDENRMAALIFYFDQPPAHIVQSIISAQAQIEMYMSNLKNFKDELAEQVTWEDQLIDHMSDEALTSHSTNGLELEREVIFARKRIMVQMELIDRILLILKGNGNLQNALSRPWPR